MPKAKVTLPRHPPKRTMTKQEAVRHLIHSAGRMIAAREDPFAIHLLIQSADKLLIDLAKKAGKPLTFRWDQFVKPEYKDALVSVIRETYNFFKHADRDHDAELYVGEIVKTNILQLGLCIVNYGAVFGDWTDHMKLLFNVAKLISPKGFVPTDRRVQFDAVIAKMGSTPPRARRLKPAARPSSASGGSSTAPSPTAWRKPAIGCSPSHDCRRANGAARARPMRSSGCTRSSNEGSRRRPCCHRQIPPRCYSGRCLPPARSTCARSMAGRRSPQSPSINRLTSQPETIPSCYRRSRHAEFQPHHGRHRVAPDPEHSPPHSPQPSPAATPPDRDPRPKCSSWKKPHPLPMRPLLSDSAYFSHGLRSRPPREIKRPSRRESP